jgi:hypothetical protein
MNCPICHFSELNDNDSSCPQCNTDLELLKQIRLTASKVKRQTIILISFGSVFLLATLILSLILITSDEVAIPENPEIKMLIAENMTLKESAKVLGDSLAGYVKQSQSMVSQETDTEKFIEYTVQEGDNLWTIAHKNYGDGNKYIKIVRDNKLTSPDKITKGTVLKIYK